MPPLYLSVPFSIGCAVLFFAIRALGQFLVFHFMRPSNPLHLYRGNDGKQTYALITGASGGIGFAVAQELVSRGFGVILLAHIPAELAAAEEKLKRVHPDAAVHTLLCDAMTVSDDALVALVSSIAHLPVSILINNVGSIPIALPAFRTLESHSFSDVDNVIHLNARFMTNLTRLMLPRLSRPSSPRSLILNISSLGRIGMPWISMYSATKAYNAALSHALTRELAAEKLPVDCLAIVPADVKTDGNRQGVNKGSPDAAAYAPVLLDCVDGAIKRGYVEVSPYWLHALQIAILSVLPEQTKTDSFIGWMARKRDGFAKEE